VFFGYFSTKLWLPTLVGMENCYDIFGFLTFCEKNNSARRVSHCFGWYLQKFPRCNV